MAGEGELLRERWAGHAKMQESVLGAGAVKQWDILSSAHFSTQQLPSFKKSVRLPWWSGG